MKCLTQALIRTSNMRTTRSSETPLAFMARSMSARWPKESMTLGSSIGQGVLDCFHAAGAAPHTQAFETVGPHVDGDVADDAATVPAGDGGHGGMAPAVERISVQADQGVGLEAVRVRVTGS